MTRVLGLFALLCLVGCTAHTDNQSKKAAPVQDAATQAEKEEADIRAALAKLAPEDRKAAEAQRWCAVAHASRLGDMGEPYKVTLKDSSGTEQVVFLCCEGCKKRALAHPEQTLADVAKLKEKAAAKTP